MDLVSYTDDAVRLVNTVDPARPGRDELADLPALRSFLAERPQLRERATDSDLPALIALRGELREVFESVAREDAPEAASAR